MSRRNSRGHDAANLVTLARLLAYPRLREVPPAQWNSVLERARGIAFDTLEWVGILAGVAFVTYVLRAGAAVPAPVFFVYLWQFVLAIPLLIVSVGPFLVRRTRRGLDLQLAHSHGGNQCEQTTPPCIGDVPRHSIPGRPK
jgi:hypothetical protein